jgi:transcription initiation factor TFIID subunit 13
MTFYSLTPKKMKEKKKISFLKEIRLMMYGYGDVSTPRQDTAEVLQDYVIDYIKVLLTNTQNMAKIKGKTKTEDLLYCLKRDRRKYTRVKDLLMTNEELKNARKAFDYEEYEKD